MMPCVLSSGSSAAGLATALSLGAIPVQYPEPPARYTGNGTGVSGSCGLRIGIIARPTQEEAWRAALDRFPEDRQGQITHKLALKVSDSAWHRRLSEIGSSIGPNDSGRGRDTYWLGPFNNYKTFCPYLVGSYDAVSDALQGYLAAGYDTIILDIPAAEEEFDHMRSAFQFSPRSTAA